MEQAIKSINGIDVTIGADGRFHAVVKGKHRSFSSMRAAELAILPPFEPFECFASGTYWNFWRPTAHTITRTRKGKYAGVTFLDARGIEIGNGHDVFIMDREKFETLEAISSEIEALVKKQKDILDSAAHVFESTLRQTSKPPQDDPA